MGIRRAASEYGSALPGDQALTIAGTAVAEPIRLRWGTPTASVGHYVNPHSVVDLYQDDLTDVKFIRVSSSSTAHITYFG